jgi:regulator of cell morphogenesis and NO signaling
MRVHAHIPVGEIAASLPHTTKLFDLFGIDYVCHGDLSLREACAEAGVDASIVRKAIDALPSVAEEPSWSDASMQELLNELRDKRHPQMRRTLGHVGALLAEAPATDAIDQVRAAFGALCDVLQPHMTHEEHMLFPVIQHLEDCWTRSEPVSVNFVGGITKPMASLIEEHTHVLEKLKAVMQHAAQLGSISEELGKVRDAIAGLEHELREHIHLENNVLYPRATAIEAAVSGAPQK